jgi:hypothetical protein
MTPEAWLRGPVDGVPEPLQPVAHALIQALEELETVVPTLTPEELHARPGGAASIAFHLLHLAGSTDRLFTYARGEELSEEQGEWLRREKEASEDDGRGGINGPGAIRSPGDPDGETLLAAVRKTEEAALDQLRNTDPASLDHPREVGRARLPSSVRGLLHHAGEHAARHTGQVATTAKVVSSGGDR